MFWLGCIVWLLPGSAPGQRPPVIPIGYDAYQQWARWPYLRVGERTSMRSTYDRAGGNEGADASHFLFQLSDDRNVTLDLEGAGVLAFVRFNHWHGSPWHFTIDGRDHQVSESSTSDPLHPVPASTWLPSRVFAPPWALTWATTRGADLSWVPMPFAQSLRLAYTRTHYGTGYYIYEQFVPGARLSQPLRTFDWRPPPQPLSKLLGEAGTDRLLPPHLHVRQGHFTLPAGGTVTLLHLLQSPTLLRSLEISLPQSRAVALSRARLRVFWDGRPQPSIDVPLALFFGTGTLYNRDAREYLVKAFPVSIRFVGGRVVLACYFPMPFLHSVRMTLQSPTDAPGVPDLRWRVRYQSLHDSAAFPRRDAAYFHATYRDHPKPEAGSDLLLLDTQGVEHEPLWAGHLVGTSFIFSHRANLNTLEGDPRFFFDDSQTPQVQGTGTEEWGGGGDYWGGENMTLPFAGHPTGAPNPAAVREPEDGIESAYRFLLGDLMPFGRRAVIRLEHGGEDQSEEHYETVAYWYGLPRPTLVASDALQVGNAASEAAHRYYSPQASPATPLTSRYEWGVDHLQGREIFPASSDLGRTTHGTSEFSLRLNPDNWGVLLRRKLDDSYANQRARVYVRCERCSHPAWQTAGTWFLAGSNTVVYSNPPGELGITAHRIETSNRRFRDDEFLLPLALTRGRRQIRLRLVFAPLHLPLFPGGPVPPEAWSEMRYNAYCFVDR